GAIFVGFLFFRHSSPVSVPLANAPKLKTKPQASASNRTIKPIAAETTSPVVPAKPWVEPLLHMQKITAVAGMFGEDNFKVLTDFLETIPATDIPDALNKLQPLQTQNPTIVGHELVLRLLQRWPENDVHSAADWIAKMPNSDDRQAAIAALASTWARQNFAE